MGINLLRFFSPNSLSSTMKTSSTPPEIEPVTDLPYHRHIRRLHADFPHLRSLSLYSEAIERGRGKGQLGSHDSDSIIVAEICSNGDVLYDRIDCYDTADIDSHHEVLCGEGDAAKISSRILLVEDLSPSAIEALGTGFRLDPHVFYFHLGFDTRRSAMRDLVDPVRESMIPVTWYMPRHGPSDFVSVPIPCDLKSSLVCDSVPALSLDSTYARQTYSPLTKLSGSSKDWQAPYRAFHRLSMIFGQSQIKTGKIVDTRIICICLINPDSTHSCLSHLETAVEIRNK